MKSNDIFQGIKSYVFIETFWIEINQISTAEKLFADFSTVY